MTRKSLEKRWRAAIIRACQAQGMREWTMQLDIRKRILNARGKPSTVLAQYEPGSDPYVARIALSELVQESETDLDRLAGHEVAHVWMEHIAALSGVNPDKLCHDPAFNRWMEAVCDKIAAITQSVP